MKTILFCSVALGVIFLSGCSQQAGDSSTAGFTTTLLGGSGEFAIKDSVALSGYESVYLKNVIAQPMASAATPIASDVAALEFTFEKAFKNKVGAVLPIVTTPGDKTLIAEAWIHEFTAMPVGADAYDPADPEALYGNVLISGTSLYVDELTVKVSLESPSGELLATFTDSDFGSDIEVAPTGMTNWPRVSEAFGAWCSELATQLSAAVEK